MKKRSLFLLTFGLICSTPWAAMAMGKSNSRTHSDPAPIPSAVPQSPAFIGAAVQQIYTQEIALRTSIGGNSLSSALPSSAAQMPVLQAAFIGGLTNYISENPDLFGGDPDRGFTPKIWKAIVQVMMERTLQMTSDGILLPPRSGLEVRRLGNDRTASGAIRGARLFLVDRAGQLIGPNMRPLMQKGIATLDGATMSLGSQAQEFSIYANLTQAMRSSALAISSEVMPSTSGIDDPVVLTWGQCFGLAAENDFNAASACFSAAGEQTLADAAALGQNLVITGARGAAGGAAVGSVTGIGAGAGAAYGALVNVLAVVYNTFLRTESITPQQLRNLMDLIATYTYSPTAYGEILPGQGQWAITKMGQVRRVTDFGNGQYALLDVKGELITKSQSIVMPGNQVKMTGNFGIQK